MNVTDDNIENDDEVERKQKRQTEHSSSEQFRIREGEERILHGKHNSSSKHVQYLHSNDGLSSSVHHFPPSPPPPPPVAGHHRKGFCHRSSPHSRHMDFFSLPYMDQYPYHHHRHHYHQHHEKSYISPTEKHFIHETKLNGPHSRHGSPHSQHDGPNSQHDHPNFRHDGPISRHDDGPISRHDGPNSRHDGPNSQHDGPNSLHKNQNRHRESSCRNKHSAHFIHETPHSRQYHSGSKPSNQDLVKNTKAETSPGEKKKMISRNVDRKKLSEEELEELRKRERDYQRERRARIRMEKVNNKHYEILFQKSTVK